VLLKNNAYNHPHRDRALEIAGGRRFFLQTFAGRSTVEWRIGLPNGRLSLLGCSHD
jgi:hypothetical protein